MDLLHARMAEPFAPHVHDGFSIGVCLEGLEMIRYRGRAALRRTGQRGYPAARRGAHRRPVRREPISSTGSCTRAAELLGDGAARPPRFPEPVVMDPALATELRRAHAGLAAARGAGPAQPTRLLAQLVVSEPGCHRAVGDGVAVVLAVRRAGPAPRRAGRARRCTAGYRRGGASGDGPAGGSADRARPRWPNWPLTRACRVISCSGRSAPRWACRHMRGWPSTGWPGPGCCWSKATGPPRSPL